MFETTMKYSSAEERGGTRTTAQEKMLAISVIGYILKGGLEVPGSTKEKSRDIHWNLSSFA